MIPNILVLIVAALIPLVIGFVWYHPKVFGTAWLQHSGLTEEKIKGGNKLLIFGLSYVMAILAAIMLYVIVVHQSHFYSLFADKPDFADPNSDTGKYIAGFMAEHGHNFRTFTHGLFHGSLAGVLLVTPIIAINALFERKSVKYIAINSGYWLLVLALMGGVIAQFA